MLKLLGKTVNGTDAPRGELSSCTEGQETRTKMRNLIVNADDLGWTPGVNRGIAEAHRNGIVTSASLLANGCAFEDGVQATRELPRLGIGVHLNLSDGKSIAPVKQVRTLLNDRGEFSGGPEALLLRLTAKSLNLAEVETEWSAQIEKVRGAGIRATHLDGHKHVQMLPGLFGIAVRLAKKYGIAAVRVSHESSKLRAALSEDGSSTSITVKQGVQARALKFLARDAHEMAERSGIWTADFFCGIAQTGVMTKKGVLQLLRTLPDGTTELMCHPGYADAQLKNTATRLQESRQTELQILMDNEIRKSIAALGIRLINYEEIGTSGT